MNRPWYRWFAFAACFAVLLGALGWMTVTLLHFEQEQSAMLRQAQLEERVRLALWRMDSALTALIVEESARPASAYQTPPHGGSPVSTALQNFPSPGIRLRFQREPDGSLTSPQVPLSPAQPTSHGQDLSLRLKAVRSLLDQTATAAAFHEPASMKGPHQEMTRVPANNWDVLMRESAVAPGPIEAPGHDVSSTRALDTDQRLLNSNELQSRANVFQQATQQAAANSALLPDTGPSAREAGALVFKALWLNGEIVLARRAFTPAGPVVQGVWLDWPHLRGSLLDSIRDLFPNAELRPTTPTTAGDAGRRFATMPVELVPRPEPESTVGSPSPLQLSLGLAWAGILLAAAAVATLLHGTISLSERRAAFVSAVTHELRTPLTTFKLYSEMLAEDMVTDPAQRKNYLTTLTTEATRLSHLVENVLAYARLERGPARPPSDHLTVRALIDRLAPRLAARAKQADLILVTDTNTPAATAKLAIDVSAVEQILFNLVDNACKYAGPDATEKRLHVEVMPAPDDARFATLRLRDHGPGLSKEAARRLFQPFSRSSSAAARGVPGVGLGLALSQRLSRSLGGRLSHDPTITDGAAFLLRLPLASSSEHKA